MSICCHPGNRKRGGHFCRRYTQAPLSFDRAFEPPVISIRLIPTSAHDEGDDPSHREERGGLSFADAMESHGHRHFISNKKAPASHLCQFASRDVHTEY